MDRLDTPDGTVLTDLVYDDQGRIWIGDYERKLILRWSGGQWQTVLDGSGLISATFKFVPLPGGGAIFVTDTVNHRILVYSAQGFLVRTFGKEGKEPGELKFPNKIVMYENNLLVVNTNAHRLDLFSTDGSYLKSLGNVAEPGAYRFPTMVALIPGGTAFLLTTDLFHAKAVTYDFNETRTGEFTPPRPLSDAGDICFADGKVIITDRAVRQVYAFDAATRSYLGVLNENIAELSRSVSREARWYSFIGLAAVILLAVVFLSIAVYFVKFRRRQIEESLRTPGARLDEKPNVVWAVPADRRRSLTLVILSCAILLLSFGLKVFAAKATHYRPLMLPITAVMLMVFVVFLRSLLKNVLTNSPTSEQVKKLLSSSMDALKRKLAPGEQITGCTSVIRPQRRNASTLLIMTDRRLFVAEFGRAFLDETLNWIASVWYHEILDVRLAPAPLYRGWELPFVRLEGFVLTITCTHAGATKSFTCFAFSRQLLERVAGMLETHRDRREPVPEPSPDEPRSAAAQTDGKGSLLPVILSGLFPGLGQFYNRQILKGTVLAALFSLQVVMLTRPFYQLIDRSVEVRPQDVPLVVFAFSTLVLTWIAGILDARKSVIMKNGIGS